MPDPLPALVGYGVRRRMRSRGTWLLIAAGIAAAGYAISGWGRAAGESSAASGSAGGGGAGAALEVVILAAGLVAGALAASSAASLPADAATGATSWLAASRASHPSLRTAPAVAGATVAISASLIVVGVFGLLSLATGHRVETRLHEPAPIRGSSIVRAPEGSREGTAALGQQVEIDVPAVGDGPVVLEVEARPRFRDLEAAILHTIPVWVKGPGVDAQLPFLVRGATRVTFAAPGPVVLLGVEMRVDLKIVAASSLGPTRSGLGDLAKAGLLLGLGLACGAPLAVLLSRALSPVTAAGACALLLAVGASRDALRSLASDAASVHGGTMAAGILRAATSLSPDLTPLSHVADVAAGRAIPSATLLLLAPALAYALACLVAAAWLPAREGRP